MKCEALPNGFLLISYADQNGIQTIGIYNTIEKRIKKQKYLKGKIQNVEILDSPESFIGLDFGESSHILDNQLATHRECLRREQ